jgi:hypothetical protein
MTHPACFRDTFFYFRKVWSPRASYHLTRIRYGEDWQLRLVSAVWLAHQRISISGAVPALDFKGLKP